MAEGHPKLNHWLMAAMPSAISGEISYISGVPSRTVLRNRLKYSIIINFVIFTD